MPFGTDTGVVPSDIVLEGGPSPSGNWEIWGRNPSQICIANCSQTVTYNGMLTIAHKELHNALSNGTIVYPIRFPLPQNNMFEAMPPSAE